MIFETERLIVRKLVPGDLPDFHDMQGNPRVMQYVGGKAMSLEENRKDLQDVIDSYTKPDNDFWVWAVLNRTKNELLGTCALIRNESDEREIGFRFREKYWRKGYGREICRALLQYGLEKMKVGTIVAYVDKNNGGSVKILEQCMEFVKEFYNEQEKCVDRKYILHASPEK